MALERLHQILLFRELDFSLAEIGDILDAPGFDRMKALDQQIELLTMKKERLEKMIAFAREVKLRQKGEIKMEFGIFDNTKLEEYAKRAKESWGDTKEYAEYSGKSAGRTAKENKGIADGLMSIFAELGRFRGRSVDDGEVQELVAKLKAYISEHYYNCGNEMLSSLGKMYAADGEFKENIDKAGGDGTAVFAAGAIDVFCSKPE